jgi:hypothetical protein
MRKVWVVTSAFLMTATMLAQGSVERTLMDLVRQWSRASVGGDVKTIEASLAPGFVSMRRWLSSD